MRTVRAISVIGLATFLILSGLVFLGQLTYPVLLMITGLIGLVTGVLIFISISHWLYHKDGIGR